MLVEKASELNKLVNKAKQEAWHLLKEAVDTGDIRQALNVFLAVNKLLPMHEWIIDERAYPLVRPSVDARDYNRCEVIRFSNMYDEEFYIVRNDPQPQHGRKAWDPEKLEKATAIVWEIVKNGHAGFTLDW